MLYLAVQSDSDGTSAVLISFDFFKPNIEVDGEDTWLKAIHLFPGEHWRALRGTAIDTRKCTIEYWWNRSPWELPSIVCLAISAMDEVVVALLTETAADEQIAATGPRMPFTVVRTFLVLINFDLRYVQDDVPQ